MSAVLALICLQIGFVPVLAGAAQTTALDPAAVAAHPGQVQLRREYNEVAAAIDTLIRRYGSDSLERLTRSFETVQQAGSADPRADPLVLLFWADDEAEVFLNGYPVGRTRLVPTRVDIPRFYLEDHNVLRVHCWDTDSVESGFMAGLYLQGPGDRLRSVVLTTEAFRWQSDETPAQEIFYTHSVPDIPGARVIWGDHLFGELWLQVEFSKETIASAALKPDSVAPPQTARPRSMEFHQVVSRLVSLENRRDQLIDRMDGWVRNKHLRYRGTSSVHPGAAFSLGRAAPLLERASVRASRNLQQWAQALPAPERELVLRPQRHLKGWQAATPAVSLGDGAPSGGGREDRRADYQPPPESSRGTRAGYVQRSLDPSGRSLVPIGSAWIWIGTVFLATYVASASWQWWRLFTSAEWT